MTEIANAMRAAAADAPLSLGARLYRDILSKDALVGPLGGFLLTALFGLVATLTIFYAPAQFIDPSEAVTATERGVIPVSWGYATIAVLTLIALFSAYEPIRRKRSLLKRRSSDDQLSWRPWNIFGNLWSAIDVLFADGFARIGGASLSSVWARYGVGAVWIAIGVGAGLYAPAPLGLGVVLFTVAIIIGVARRWSWIERDRTRYMIERRGRERAQLVGFDQDLRDEALIGLACLFLLAPLALAQVQSWTCATTSCAFTFQRGYALPENPLWAFIDWLGFFGAELAKAAPFVDWSEVFGVENDSPIEAANAFGAQVVFLMRASIDLLLLASILQAVQVAAQLRAQRDSFDAKELPVLEPFEEAIEFQRIANSAPLGLELRLDEQPALANISHYEPKRLQQIVEDPSHPRARREIAAAALMRQSQDPALEPSAPAIDAFFTRALAAETDAETKAWLTRASMLLEPEAATEEERAALPGIVSDASWDWRVRAAAARAMGRYSGRSPLDGDATDRLATIAKAAGAPVKLRADTGLALAKHGVSDAADALKDLLERLGQSDLPVGAYREAVVTASGGLARLDQPMEALSRLGVTDLSKGLDLDAPGSLAPFLALRGIRTQAAPMDHEAARAAEVGMEMDETVRIAPGEAPFPQSFMMGAAKPEGVFYPPQREVTLRTAFALGRYSVTFEEWRGFRLTFDLSEAPSLGRSNMKESDVLRWPANEVSWRDANTYCAWLSRVTGERWRLPREAEWEYACRAGTNTAYSWGDDEPSKEQANWQGAFGRPVNVEGDGENRDGAFVNAWGLCQMHGNAAEWCAEAWSETPEEWENSQAVLRGGSWIVGAQYLRSAIRSRLIRDNRSNAVGFRVCRTLAS